MQDFGNSFFPEYENKGSQVSLLSELSKMEIMVETIPSFWQNPGDAKQYDEFTQTMFAGIYPVIASQIIDRTGITTGTCLDIGSGPAPLAIALAVLSNISVTALDSSPEMYNLALKNISSRHLEERITPIIGDVHAIPAADASMDLVVSRGSYHFWEDLPAAFREIHRVLKTGGQAYIGGGYGSAKVRDDVLAGRKKRGIVDDPVNPSRTRFRKFRPGEIEAAIQAAGICEYRIINDDTGFWILITKSSCGTSRSIAGSGDPDKTDPGS